MYFKRPWLISTVSVISAYLCCQAPRWIGFIAGDAFKSNIADHISYVISIILAYFLLKKYVANSVRQLMEKSNQSLLLFAAVPIFYYLFDYATIIYPDILYRDAKWVVQFIPTVVSVFYFIFITLYYTEILKQAASQRERDMLNIHLQHSKTELTTLRQLQECTAVYRHDMRHHITFLQGLASKGRIDEIKEYLKTAQSDIENITPVRFCENETVNLILSAFSSESKQKKIKFSIEANLPKFIPLTDTEICSLLSNSLENAINAASKCSDP
ncbi:MAG TPA: ATP-binding protein, partial [Clostridia bacterium]|nr:ATP-binding protein [Clostridia bacterium]